MAEVPATVTPLTLETAAYALMVAADAAGLFLTRAGALLLLALIWVETGRGQKPRQHNVGNVMARGYRPTGVEYSVWSGDYWRPEWFTDTSMALYQKMLDGKAPSAFRAYASLVDGMADYVGVLLNKPDVINAANSGDVPQFVAELSRAYSPDYGPEHVKTFNSLASDFRKAGYFAELSEAPRKVGGGSSSGGGGIVLGLAGVLAVIWGLLRKAKRR